MAAGRLAGVHAATEKDHWLFDIEPLALSNDQITTSLVQHHIALCLAHSLHVIACDRQHWHVEPLARLGEKFSMEINLRRIGLKSLNSNKDYILVTSVTILGLTMPFLPHSRAPKVQIFNISLNFHNIAQHLTISIRKAKGNLYKMFRIIKIDDNRKHGIKFLIVIDIQQSPFLDLSPPPLSANPNTRPEHVSPGPVKSVENIQFPCLKSLTHIFWKPRNSEVKPRTVIGKVVGPIRVRCRVKYVLEIFYYGKGQGGGNTWLGFVEFTISSRKLPESKFEVMFAWYSWPE